MGKSGEEPQSSTGRGEDIEGGPEGPLEVLAGRSEALGVDDAGAVLVVVGPADPHLVEHREHPQHAAWGGHWEGLADSQSHPQGCTGRQGGGVEYHQAALYNFINPEGGVPCVRIFHKNELGAPICKRDFTIFL